MRRRAFLLSISPLLFGALTLVVAVASPQHTKSSAPPLQSFYIVNHAFSDYLSKGYDEILDVEAAGDAVRVRVIRISLANPYCGTQLVRAAEHVLPNTTISQITGTVDLCSFKESAVAAALNAAKPKAIQIIEDSATQTIVARCGTEERVLDFPYPEEVDLKALQQRNPRLWALWNVYYDLRRRSFGDHFSMYNLSAARETEFENLGRKTVPELVSGKFDAGFGGHTCGTEKCPPSYLAWRLRTYTGEPGTSDPFTVELLDAPSLHLVKADLPKFPPLAKVTRISGEVRLKIFFDQQTGFVKDVQRISGQGLLGDSAIESAKKWQFTLGSSSDQPVEAILKFVLACPGE